MIRGEVWLAEVGRKRRKSLNVCGNANERPLLQQLAPPHIPDAPLLRYLKIEERAKLDNLGVGGRER